MSGFVIWCRDDDTYHAGEGLWVTDPRNAEVYAVRATAAIARDDVDQEGVCGLRITDLAEIAELLEGRPEPCPLAEYDCGDPRCDTHHAECSKHSGECWHSARDCEARAASAAAADHPHGQIAAAIAAHHARPPESTTEDKSQIHDDSEVYELGGEGDLVIPRWLAVEKGLV